MRLFPVALILQIKPTLKLQYRAKLWSTRIYFVTYLLTFFNYEMKQILEFLHPFPAENGNLTRIPSLPAIEKQPFQTFPNQTKLRRFRTKWKGTSHDNIAS